MLASISPSRMRVLRFLVSVSWCYRQSMNSASDCQEAPYKDTIFLIVAIYTAFSITYRYLWIDVIPPAVAHEGDIIGRIDLRGLLDQIHRQIVFSVDL